MQRAPFDVLHVSRACDGDCGNSNSTIGAMGGEDAGLKGNETTRQQLLLTAPIATMSLHQELLQC